MANEFDSEALRKRLDAILLVLIENAVEGGQTMKQRINRLLELGFTKPEIAKILGKKINYITAMTPKGASAQTAKGDA